MHQTFYIEHDEELTTIVERLRVSKSRDVVLVAPRRALLLQSVINMRILRREADKQKKTVVIVTQDPDGTLIAQKAGLTVRASVRDGSGDEEIRETLHPEIATETTPIRVRGTSERMIGTEEYVMTSPQQYLSTEYPIQREGMGTSQSSHLRGAQKEERENILNHELVNGIMSPSSDVLRRDKASSSADLSRVKQSQSFTVPQDSTHDRAARKEKALTNFFTVAASSKTVRSSTHTAHVPRPLRRIVFSAAAASLLILFCVGLYVIFPYTVVTVKPKTQTLAGDLDLSGDAAQQSVDTVGGILPVRLIVAEDQVTETFSAIGTDSAAGQKARGMVTLYNTYSAESQRLVATTRLLAADGKLFRLMKDTTIPGMVVADGTTVAGAVEAEVIADQPGEEQNIAPTRFSIPGFQGTAKYEKFYAESKQPMSGGNTIGGAVTTVSTSDSAQAKKAVEEKLEKELREKMNAQQKEGEILLENAIEKRVVSSAPSIAVGAVAQSFTYTAHMRLRAIVFLEQNVRSAAHVVLAQRNATQLPIDPSAISVEYGTIIPYFDEQKITLKATSTSQLSPSIDAQSFKELVRGKNQEQIRDLLRTMPDIESLTFSFWPGFFPGRVSWMNPMSKVVVTP
ncbi:MAG TPA: hypothetical protein VJL38_00350 [Patescibacteria group bacterium]|nr:hypothetical protein [Patescibacteria group bacterium]